MTPDLESMFDALEQTVPTEIDYISSKRAENTISAFYMAVCYLDWNHVPRVDVAAEQPGELHRGPGVYSLTNLLVTRHGIVVNCYAKNAKFEFLLD